jgi:hypothetical protein
MGMDRIVTEEAIPVNGPRVSAGQGLVLGILELETPRESDCRST